MTVDIVNELTDTLMVRIDADDLTEILGALLENAVKFARREVHISGIATDHVISLQIEDDGPGMEAEAAEQALGRGVRLDERSSGHGLGLSIARDLVEATDGRIELGRSARGGLRVTLNWPV
jgi:signal transduction histidine kinase